jgi:protoporphyrinogen/coproporphyrinogen III oxidase
VTHRFGKALLPFADVAMTGTFAGDIERLSLDAALPGLRRLELTHGSVFRGAIRHQKQRSGSGLPAMVSFKGGMEELIETLARDRTIRFRSEVTAIVREADGWRLQTLTDEYRATRVVLAVHINPALSILDRLSPAPRRSVAEAVIYNVVFGFGAGADIPFGFGYLAPKVENRFALGALFPTHMFPDRAPKGIQTLEVLVGGTRNPEHLTLDDDTLVQAALADVRQLIRLPEQPLFTRLLKPTIGIPQLEIGHQALLDYRARMEKEHPGLFICGFGWEGIGTNEMIKMAGQTVAAITNPSSRSNEPAAVKGVYF